MSLFSELKRRNIFKVAVAYLALGWVLVQITDVVVPALNLPDTLNSIVVYIGIIGFPIALFFAWAFELTPDGLMKWQNKAIITLLFRSIDVLTAGIHLPQHRSLDWVLV